MGFEMGFEMGLMVYVETKNGEKRTNSVVDNEENGLILQPKCL